MADTDEWVEMEDDGFMALVGPIYRRATQGSDAPMRFRFFSEPRHRNRSGFVHGGMLMAFADRAMGTTARRGDPSRFVATIQLDMHFMSQATVGEWLEIRCRVVKETRSLAFVDGEIVIGDLGVAIARGVWKSVRANE